MTNELCFVQFLHPGQEHRPDRIGSKFKEWNKKDHKRKFLRCQGRRYGVGAQDLLHFWAEWEPESEVLETIARPIKDGPELIYAPFYVRPATYSRHQNTDPFVFGKNFFYTLCRQYTKKGPTQLRWLDRGSVILFGSCRADSFRLDTVFVVDRFVDHSKKDFKEKLRDLPQEYFDVMLLPMYYSKGPCPKRGRLYYGATPERSVDGMFSFFPCQPVASSPRGFVRPKISIPDVISDSLKMNMKLEAVDLSRIRDLWSCVRSQVESAGLSLGVYAELPERRSLPIRKPRDRRLSLAAAHAYPRPTTAEEAAYAATVTKEQDEAEQRSGKAGSSRFVGGQGDLRVISPPPIDVLFDGPDADYSSTGDGDWAACCMGKWTATDQDLEDMLDARADELRAIAADNAATEPSGGISAAVTDQDLVKDALASFGGTLAAEAGVVPESRASTETR